MRIVIVDGQGGRLGKLLVESVRERIPQAEVWGMGTNGIATSAMLKAGAHCGATGENPIIRAMMRADVVMGPVGIVVAHAIMGEVTPAIAEAVGSCAGEKFLIPMNSCGVIIAGLKEMGLTAYVKDAVDKAAEYLMK